MTHTVHVADMNCGHCKAKVENAARNVPSVTAAEVDLEAGTLSFETAGGSAMEAVMEAVRGAGYEPASSA
jgi:copper chaperone